MQQQQLEMAAYWRLRALLGDIDRVTMQVAQLRQQLAALIDLRSVLLREAFGPDVDLNFMSDIAWNDDTQELTLHGATRVLPLTVVKE